MKGDIDELDCACASTESSRLYLHAMRASLNYSLSSPSARGLRRNVAQHPQRALNSSIHFTACKAIIFAPPSPTLLLGLLSQLTFIWRVAPSTETLLICPPFVRGKCSQTSQAYFCIIARLGAPAGIGFKVENENLEQRCSLVTTHTHTNH